VVDLDDALYVYWQLKSYGEDAVAVLDGGMAGWLLEGRPFTVEPVAERAGTWRAKADRRARYDAGSLDVAAAAARRDATLVDARDARMFHGLTKRDYVHGYGRIDGARHLPPELLTRTEQGVVRLYGPDTYRALLADRGIPTDAPAISYCNSGQLASGPWFVMSELLGNPAARMYDGSLHQWTLEKRTLVGAAPR
jgi:thiosulfate/3-mercaptopyruvate sulfurtransferase